MKGKKRCGQEEPERDARDFLDPEGAEIRVTLDPKETAGSTTTQKPVNPNYALLAIE